MSSTRLKIIVWVAASLVPFGLAYIGAHLGYIAITTLAIAIFWATLSLGPMSARVRQQGCSARVVNLERTAQAHPSQPMGSASERATRPAAPS
ncbi:hypothetical protein [Sorangium sp. So ce1078]|uniref:hypothetical protein n=1 Tax=Sorangium sp. So ce1078 TaxID=3133329 RepID=UPI003F61EE36